MLIFNILDLFHNFIIPNQNSNNSMLSYMQLEEIRIKTQEKEEAETHQLFKIKRKDQINPCNSIQLRIKSII